MGRYCRPSCYASVPKIVCGLSGGALDSHGLKFSWPSTPGKWRQAMTICRQILLRLWTTWTRRRLSQGDSMTQRCAQLMQNQECLLPSCVKVSLMFQRPLK